MPKIYILDTNTFIEAKNTYYDMSICPAFWDFIDEKFSESIIFSTNSVYKELIRGNDDDPLVKWSKDRKDTGFFLDDTDIDTQKVFIDIVTYVSDHPRFAPKQKERFLSEADPLIISKSKTFEATIITNEVLVPIFSTKVKIPNVCSQFNVSYLDPFSMLKELNAEFIL